MTFCQYSDPCANTSGILVPILTINSNGKKIKRKVGLEQSPTHKLLSSFSLRPHFLFHISPPSFYYCTKYNNTFRFKCLQDIFFKFNQVFNISFMRVFVIFLMCLGGALWAKRIGVKNSTYALLGGDLTQDYKNMYLLAQYFLILVLEGFLLIVFWCFGFVLLVLFFNKFFRSLILSMPLRLFKDIS